VVDELSDNYLHGLASKGDWEGMESFLKNPSISTDHKNKSLSYCGGGREVNALTVSIGLNAPYRIVQRILNIAPQDIITSTDKYGFTPLHAACAEKRHTDVLKLLVDRSPLKIFNSIDSDGHTPFHLAIANGASLEVVQLVLKKTSTCTTPTSYRTKNP